MSAPDATPEPGEGLRQSDHRPAGVNDPSHRTPSSEPSEVDPRYRMIVTDDDGSERAYDVRDLTRHDLVDPDIREGRYWSLIAALDEIATQAAAIVSGHFDTGRSIDDKFRAAIGDVLAIEDEIARARRILERGEL